MMGQTNRTQVLYLNGTVGVIVFSTSAFSSNNGTGFRLNFEGLGSPDNGVQTGSDLILAGNYGSTLHPPVGSDGF
ncbi:unnamed protein product [Orchesella dallaii]|uniref:Legume lectin domain-containing protein n=1 Tax=Orchesella dallaii TaxID=48710 RepID=A0ABP1Q5L3_9HEXA